MERIEFFNWNKGSAIHVEAMITHPEYGCEWYTGWAIVPITDNRSLEEIAVEIVKGLPKAKSLPWFEADVYIHHPYFSKDKMEFDIPLHYSDWLELCEEAERRELERALVEEEEED